MKLSETNEFSWHRLMSYPDRLDGAGPTAFYVSWHRSPISKTIEVSYRDDHHRPCFEVSGRGRTQKYLDTEVVPE